MGILLDFTGSAPPLSTVRAHVAARAACIPSLGYRVAPDGRSARLMPEFTAEEHVFELELPQDKDGSEAGKLMLSLPLPEAPPWDVWLIRRGDDAYTLCYRSDHTLRDGRSTACIARTLLDDQPNWHPRLVPLLRPGLGGFASVLREGVSAMRSPTAAPAFAGELTAVPEVFHADTALETLREVGRAHGATVNDVYLAALSEAVRRWYAERTDRAHPPFPVSMPLSVRGPGEETTVGNKVAGARLTLPCDPRGPAAGLRQIVVQTRRLRERRHRYASNFLINAVPRDVGARVALHMADPAAIAAVTSNVDVGPALVHQGAQAGQAALLTSLAAGLRCFTALTGYHDNARLTVVHDACFTGIQRLGEHWVAAVHTLATD
ncbi:wax ester/triacylglycerol synthase domain-containing protein [Streptomyces sp. NPDC054797]